MRAVVKILYPELLNVGESQRPRHDTVSAFLQNKILKASPTKVTCIQAARLWTTNVRKHFPSNITSSTSQLKVLEKCDTISKSKSSLEIKSIPLLTTVRNTTDRRNFMNCSN